MKLKAIVVIFLFIAVTLTGCISDDNPRIDPDVVEVDVEMDAMVVNDVSYWEMSLPISGDLVDELDELEWTDIKVGIRAPDGTDLLEPSAPEPLPDEVPDEPGVFYIADAGETVILEGDSIVVTGIDREFEGAVLRLFDGTRLVAKSMPAPSLPPLSPSVKLGQPVIRELAINETRSWNATVPIKGVTPVGEVLNWSEAEVRIVDPETGDVLLESNLSQDYQGPYPYVILQDMYGEGQIDDDDGLIIVGLTLAYEGTTVQLLVNGSVLGSTNLTDWFPIESVRVMLRIFLGEYTIGNDKYWFMNVTSIRFISPDVTPAWSELEVRMVTGEPDPGKELISRTELEEMDGTAGTTLKVGYTESDGDEDLADLWDFINVRGMNISFSNSSFELWWRGKAVGSVKLPHNLNYTDYQNVTLNIASPDVQAHLAGSTTVWDVVLNINKITPKDVRVFWKDIELKIIQDTGSVLIHPQTVEYDLTGEYDRDDSDGIDVELWAIEAVLGDDKISAGDAFKITGLSIEYEGVKIEVYAGGYLIGSVTLPTNFP
jgi:hypothetical protein